MEDKVKIGEREVTVRELKYLDILEIEQLRSTDIKGAIKNARGVFADGVRVFGR